MKKYIFLSQEGETLHHTGAEVTKNEDYHAALKKANPKGRLIIVLLMIEGEWVTIFANGQEVQVKFR